MKNEARDRKKERKTDRKITKSKIKHESHTNNYKQTNKICLISLTLRV